jgi:CRISPR-associated endonuclease/helicase Cas3
MSGWIFMGMIGPRRVQASVLSAALPLEECAAKTALTEDGRKVLGQSVQEHCLIVGEVAREILAREPKPLHKAIFPQGCELVSASHDVGKVSPDFQEMIREAIGIEPNTNPALKNANAERAGRKASSFHATVSMVTLEYLCGDKNIADIVGRHHGFLPTSLYQASEAVFGGAEWQGRRAELIDILKTRLKSEWPKVQEGPQTDAIAGLTAVSDWIGSGPFLSEISFVNDVELLRQAVRETLNKVGFVRPHIKSGLSFSDIFRFAPYEPQLKLIESAQAPGVYILEAPMGAGKTEAALYAAYCVLSRGEATGIYFALPTRLTSDKIYERMGAFLEKILEPDGAQGARLLHGEAWLREGELGAEGEPGESWFDGTKRGLLAPFGVGTIDQALMAVINVKHGFVRAFGLAGKVVILDEIHSYDCYTGILIDSLIKMLQSLGCTVIILSATLTASRRSELLGDCLSAMEPSVAYPLISALPRGGTFQETPVNSLADADVKLVFKDDWQEAFEEALLRAERGQQTLWIENTVDEAQERYRHFASRTREMQATIEVGLLHSRFLSEDRAANETKWVGYYGSKQALSRQNHGRILVGTQVLEQSLDIDADFLVTAFCPTDMIFQRMGRLWRHKDNNVSRPAGAARETWIIAPTLASALDNPKTAFGKSAFVYSPYILLRSLETWHTLESVSIPSSMRRILEVTYEERQEIGILQKLKSDLKKEKDTLRLFARGALSSGGKELPDSNVRTRYSDRPTCNVLLLKDFRPEQDGTRVSFLNGNTIFLPLRPASEGNVPWKTIWRERASAIARNIISVPEGKAPPPSSAYELDWLKNYVYIGKDDEIALRIARVGKDGTLLTADAYGSSSTCELRYDTELGYQAMTDSKKIERRKV